MTFKNKQSYLDFLWKRSVSIEKRTTRENEYLWKKLAKKIKIIKPYMPCKDNAKYHEWKIHFEKYLPYINEQTILIWKSLGGIFLAKYLSENQLSHKILSVYLVCPPYNNKLNNEDLVGWFKLPADLSMLQWSCKNLYLLFSQDDPIVPINHSEKYRKKLNNAKILIYNNKNGHFKIEKFPEIIKLINKDISSL